MYYILFTKHDPKTLLSKVEQIIAFQQENGKHIFKVNTFVYFKILN